MNRVIVFVAVGMAILASPALGCPTEAMQNAKSAADAAAAYAQIDQAGTECSAEQRNWAGRIAAAWQFKSAMAMANAGRPTAEVIAALDDALRYAPLWQIYAKRGDVHQATRPANYTAASQDYQLALNAIEAGDDKSDPVSRDTIATIFRKAEQTRMLASGEVNSPPKRDGSPGGLSARQIRNFVPQSVAMPIQFEFGTARFTAGGRRAAEDLLRLLDAEQRPTILLVGHTDPIGSAEANMRLSWERAEAVRQFLMWNGYDPRRIRTLGRGKEEPLPIEDSDGYSLEQVYQILRRVELKRI